MKPRVIYILLFFFGTLFFTASFYLKHIKPYVLSFYDIELSTSKDVIDSSELPTSITISKLNIDIPIEIASITNGKWYISDSSAVYLKESALPEKSGAMIIYAHNKKGLFKDIYKLEIEDEIIINTDSKSLKYSVYETKIVNPSDAWILDPQKESELIIYTCTGFLDTKRLVIKAIPLI